jgi:hypothetical protein
LKKKKKKKRRRRRRIGERVGGNSCRNQSRRGQSRVSGGLAHRLEQGQQLGENDRLKM